MLKERREVAVSVGLPLIEFERHIDAACVLQGQVVAAAITGRQRAHLPLHAGQKAIERMHAAMAALIEARAAAHEAHVLFRAEQDAMNIGPISYGDYGDTPRDPNEKRENGAGHLRLAS